MEEVKLIKTIDRSELSEVQDRYFVKDFSDQRLFVGDGTEILQEVKTDKSHNWAKIFFYGGN